MAQGHSKPVGGPGHLRTKGPHTVWGTLHFLLTVRTRYNLYEHSELHGEVESVKTPSGTS